MNVTVKWTRYPHFFALYERHKNDPKLIYVIGENHHCYIGSVGTKGGRIGLAQRYQKQYIDRARAIFGADTPENQPAYVGHFLDPSAPDEKLIDPDEKLIENVEKLIQKIFADNVGASSALFTLRGSFDCVTIKHVGDQIPPFLK